MVPELITEFEHEYYSFTKQNMTLPDTVIAFMLLASCRLEDKQIQVVMSGVADVTYDNMKAALKRIFGGTISESNGGVIKSEPVFECLDQTPDCEVYYGQSRDMRRRGRFGGYRGGFSRGASKFESYKDKKHQRKENPVDKKTGYVSRCAICGSKFHWASKCPDAYENSSKSFFADEKPESRSSVEDENEEVNLSLFVGYTNNKTDKEKL